MLLQQVEADPIGLEIATRGDRGTFQQTVEDPDELIADLGLHLPGPTGRAETEPVTHETAELRRGRLDLEQQFVAAHQTLPTLQDLGPQRQTRLELRIETGGDLTETVRHHRREPIGMLLLTGDGRIEGGQLGRDRGHQPVQGVLTHRTTTLEWCQGGQPVLHFPEGARGQTVVDHAGMRDGEQSLDVDPFGRQQPGGIGDELLALFGRDLGDRHRDQRLAPRGATQVGHPHLVGVGAGGGEPDPRVGGIQGALRQPAVGVRHRVDVGGVEDRDAHRQGVAGGEQEGALARHLRRLGRIDADQPRQDALGGEHRFVVRVADQGGGPRGGTDHPGGRDTAPDQRVDRGGLARAGAAADHDQQRCVRSGGTRADASQQTRHPIPLATQLLGRTRGEVEPQALERVGERGQRPRAVAGRLVLGHGTAPGPGQPG